VSNDWLIRAVYDGTGVIKRHYSNLLIGNVRVLNHVLTPAQIAEECDWNRAFPPIPGLPVVSVGKYTSVILDKTGATVKHRFVELNANGEVKSVV